MKRRRASTKRAPAPAAKAPAPQPVAAPPPVIARALADAIIREAEARIRELVLRYVPDGVTTRGEPFELPERVPEAVERVRLALTAAQGEGQARRAVNKAFIHLLSQWDKGRIEGPRTVDNALRRAATFSSVAKLLRKKGDIPGAERNEARAAEYQRRAESLAA